MATAPESIDDYIAAFPPEVQAILQRVRRTNGEAVPDAQETISYQIPTFTLTGSYLIYFAGCRRHVSVYPLPRGDPKIVAAMPHYVAGRGTLRFPLGKPVPYDLVGRMARAMAPDALERSSCRRKQE